MYQRRILIGAIIGILITTVMGWINKSAWHFFEFQVLEGRAYLNPFNPFGKVSDKLVSITIDDESKAYLLENQIIDSDTELDFSTSSEQALLIEVFKNLDSQNTKAIAFLPQLPDALIQDLQIEKNIENVKAPVIFANEDNLTYKNMRRNKLHRIVPGRGFAYELFSSLGEQAEFKEGTKLWLNSSSPRAKEFSLLDFLTAKVDESLIEDSVVFLSSDKSTSVLKREMAIFANYSSGKWLLYLALPWFLLFLINAGLGVVFVLATYWARIIFFLTGVLSLFFFGQIGFSLFNTYIETVPLLVSIVAIFLISNLVDLNLLTHSLKEELKEGLVKTPEKTIKDAIVPPVTFSSANPNELRDKFYKEQEDNHESVALEIQDRIVKPMLDIQSKIDELIMDEKYEKDDLNKLHVLNYDFNKTIDDLDNIIFDLVPFHLEKDKGVINLLEHLLEKVLYKSGGAMRGSFNTQLGTLEFDEQKKINFYRVLHKLVDLIITKSRGTSMQLDLTKNNGHLEAMFSYDGLNIDAGLTHKADGYLGDYRLKDIFTRANLIEADISFNSGLDNSTDMTNKVKISMKS